MKDGTKVLVTQVKGAARCDKRIKATLKALGLGRIGAKRQHVINPPLAGMIARVEYLLDVAAVK